MGLEEAFYGSTAIRNFLKLFSEAHEKRVSKATFLIGITRLAELAEAKSKKTLANLTVEDIEKLAVKVHERYVRHKRERTAGDNIAPVYSNLNTSEKKQLRGKKRANRYRNGQQFLSTSSSHHKHQDSPTYIQTSEATLSPLKPARASSQKSRRRAADDSMSRSHFSVEYENNQQCGEHLANDSRFGNSRSLSNLAHIGRTYENH